MRTQMCSACLLSAALTVLDEFAIFLSDTRAQPTAQASPVLPAESTRGVRSLPIPPWLFSHHHGKPLLGFFQLCWEVKTS